ncbi:MAG: hypothetical protein HYZ14_06235 [Bacteroidetes bacterium]|nr:hypothetical protein [Bacteroidota bacterium]
MNAIKQIIVDSFNGLSADMIPLFLFQMLVAGLLGHLLQKILNRKFGHETLSHGALISLSVALLASVVKYSVPFAVLAAALIFLLGRSKEFSFMNALSVFLVAIVGLGCGVGSVIQTIIGFVLITAVILFIPLKK